jgi:hypothetical protein
MTVEWNGFVKADDGTVTYTPTGEDCTDFIAPGTAGTGGEYVWFGAIDRLDAIVNDPKRRPRKGWSGTVHALASHYGLSADTVAEAFGHSVAAFDASQITIGVGTPGHGARSGPVVTAMKSQFAKELRHAYPGRF